MLLRVNCCRISPFGKGPPIEAILLTHAHTDHIGALPALEAYLTEECPIYGTEPTLAIAKVMLSGFAKDHPTVSAGGRTTSAFSPSRGQ